MKKHIITGAIALCLLPLLSSATEAELLKRELTINQAKVVVELALTAKQREIGLMHRQSLAENSGMLFIHEEETAPCFWMKNTFIPLSLAYISAEHQIIQIEDLTPQSETMVCAKADILYTLEVPQGWFKQYGIIEGMKVENLTD